MPIREGNRVFFERNSGLQPQAVLYVVDLPRFEPRVLLDPNTLSKDGTVALTGTVPSRDGTLLAYGIAEAGSDWQEWRVKKVDAGEDLPDRIQWVKFSSASWTPDGRGFYYSRYDEPGPNQLRDTNYFQKLYYHRLGTPQSADRLVYERKDQKEWGFGAVVSDDGRWLVIRVSQGTDRRNRVYIQDLAKKRLEGPPARRRAGGEVRLRREPGTGAVVPHHARRAPRQGHRHRHAGPGPGALEDGGPRDRRPAR